MAERVNIIETRHKVFPIVGKVPSPSKNMSIKETCYCLSSLLDG